MNCLTETFHGFHIAYKTSCVATACSYRKEFSEEMTIEMVPKLCLLFIVCSVVATGSSSFIDQAKSNHDEVLKKIDLLEKRIATFEMTGMQFISMC